MAHADTIDNLKATIISTRADSGCAPYKYSRVLERIAQDDNLSQASHRPLNKLSYTGERLSFTGSGDPVAKAVNNAYRNGFGPTSSQCQYTEFGVSFARDTRDEVDWVTIVVGKPAAPKPATRPGTRPPPAPDPAPAPAPVPAPAPATLRATVTADVDVYDNPKGGWAAPEVPDYGHDSASEGAMHAGCVLCLDQRHLRLGRVLREQMRARTARRASRRAGGPSSPAT